MSSRPVAIARPGISVTPTPAATSPCFASHCSAPKRMRGSKPCASAAVRSGGGGAPAGGARGGQERRARRAGRRLDPRLVAQVAEPQLRLVSERMLGGERDEDLVV